MPGLDERGHQRQLRREAALLRLPGHPGGDLLPRRVVARIRIGRGRGERGGIDGGAGGRRARRPDRPARRRPPRLRRLDGLQEQLRLARLLLRRGLGRLRGDRLQEQLRGLPRRRRLGDRRDRARRGRRRPASPGAAATAAATSAGGFQSGGDLLLEAEVEVVLVRGVGEVAGTGDRPRRADLVRPDVRVQRRELARHLARDRAARPDRLAVDRRDVDAAAEEVVGDRAARGELRVVRAHARDRDLVLLAELGQHADHARVDPAGLDVGDAGRVEHDVLVVEQRQRLGVRRPAGAGALAAELLGVDRLRGGGRRRTRSGGRVDGRGGAGGRVAIDADEHDVRALVLRGTSPTRSLLLPSSAVNLPSVDVALEEPDVAVGAEVVLPAPVIGDDVPGPRVLGAHDLEAVVALLGVAHPGLHGGPAAARHLVPGLLERPRHERRAPRVAGRDLRRRRGTARPARRGSRRRSL